MKILSVFQKSYIKYLFLGLLLFTDFIKNDTLNDFNAFSWYYLTIINSIIVLYVLIEYKYYKSRIDAIISNKISIFILDLLFGQ